MALAERHLASSAFLPKEIQNSFRFPGFLRQHQPAQKTHPLLFAFTLERLLPEQQLAEGSDPGVYLAFFGIRIAGIAHTVGVFKDTDNIIQLPFQPEFTFVFPFQKMQGCILFRKRQHLQLLLWYAL